MIFNEVYGCYYNAVSKIIENAIDGELTDRKLNDLSKQYAFEESNLTIVPSIKNQQWQLIDENMKTPILNKPRMPLTMIEKRWLKTISNDSKFKLFNSKAIFSVEVDISGEELILEGKSLFLKFLLIFEIAKSFTLDKISLFSSFKTLLGKNKLSSSSILNSQNS